MKTTNYRSGFTLTSLLRDTRELTAEAEVRSLVDAAIEFIEAPRSSGRDYGRGKQLVVLLREGSHVAGRFDEVEVSNRLTDFAGHAAGEIPLGLLETWYRPDRPQDDNGLMRLFANVGVHRCGELLIEFTKERPDATVRDALRWLQHRTRPIERWTVGNDRLGGVMIRGLKDSVNWFSRVQLVLDDSPQFLEIAHEIAGLPESELIFQAVQWARRRRALGRLREIVENPTSSEQDIHTEISQQTWIFGGRYVEELSRRRLTTHDEIDVPLLRGDGSLQVVELKKAAVPNLVVPLRSHHAVGAEVHRAVSQAANYLRELDEDRASILARFGIESRRASATVLIGHSKFVGREYASEVVAATLRTYNATLNRVEVITYQELIDAAERTLALGEGG